MSYKKIITTTLLVIATVVSAVLLYKLDYTGGKQNCVSYYDEDGTTLLYRDCQ